MDKTLLSTTSSKPNYSFISKTGGRIDRSQESEIIAWNEVIEHEWTHHTFHTVIKRYHLFITLNTEDITVFPLLIINL